MVVSRTFTEAEDTYYTGMLLAVGPYVRLANGVVEYNEWWVRAHAFAKANRSAGRTWAVHDVNQIANRFVGWWDNQKHKAKYETYRQEQDNA